MAYPRVAESFFFVDEGWAGNRMEETSDILIVTECLEACFSANYLCSITHVLAPAGSKSKP